MAIEFDTIAAISTPPGEGGIGIVRISGDEALDIADRVYQLGKKTLKNQKTHTIHYGHIVNPKTEEQIDEVMVTIMKAPKTYTREDIVEINTHGGVLAVNQVLQTVLHNGARLAEPGEFTKRAFLNGRIDLSQAEAVMDVIRAKTDKAMHMAVTQLDGNLSRLIRNLRQEILNTLAQVEVNIDYPEYDDVEEMTSQLLVEKAKQVKEQVKELLETASQGKILREGLATAIIGRPNVGKSSLLNVLIKEEKAIVTEIAGTTRDVVEEYVSVKGVPLRLIDTAGIRETEDIVERIGVERSRKALAEADLILLVFNQNEPLTEEDKLLIQATDEHHRIIILNKMDLENHLDLEELKQLVNPESIVPTSIVTQDGLNDLEAKIADLFFSGKTGERDATYVSNIRHIALLNEAVDAFDDVIEGIETGMPVDLVQIDMTRAWDLLGEITGDSVQDELITQLFSQFCLGK
ncbi:tRNA uridine-5-carboxymethylaminomethyl(34) synthesis GTPase MnmE [Marinilactibacillus psychrotolerans]|uniref:tRNA modification GTPase MnmE n=2 Tax=Marinilactibacillus psychrotolerans TaxID=191770 RepID=A0AAV3WTP1_9LACT|nr:tRNA uridine-5-carboxymethylaminomethyl(34) synthesis GTPase MnmE [Marinilactibacillus psychrotolerans]SDC50203.1 tRNA modification GTPase [Marinilactibacillus psychrotolerans]SJN19917.1 GTPase and tRNA-U34 5-formylation enzyme TrmE [Marinilactibacillus psychrotolerans 42ea]GEL66541.1 tRNA modification GTPase MnmE [Marinilactibacillus psychrotolerans]GEQ34093.1 tRNA modification GTPase [Marinilactibacillus psychrotolerans]GEQ35357.1 tRNA modification GTPase [Marinilactibacillus psychrotoler